MNKLPDSSKSIEVINEDNLFISSPFERIFIGHYSYKGSLQKKNKKCGFFPHWGGSTPNPHIFKSVDFEGVGGLGSNFHTFLDIFYFF